MRADHRAHVRALQTERTKPETKLGENEMSNNARIVGAIGIGLAASLIAGTFSTELALVVGTFALPGAYFFLGEL